MIYNVFVNAENRMETDPHKTVLSRSRQSFGWHKRASGGLPSCQGAESSGNFGSKFFVNVFFSGFFACSFWENIVIVGRDHKICNFVDLYNQQVEATSKKLQLHRWNELMGCGEPTCGTDAWWDGGRFKDISRDPRLGKKHSWISTDLVNCSVLFTDSVNAFPRHSIVTLNLVALQQMDRYAATSEDATWSPRIYLPESFLNSSESWDTALTMLSLYLPYF